MFSLIGTSAPQLRSRPLFLLLVIPGVLSLISAFYVLYHVFLNYTAARKTGLPIVILPFDCGHPLWLTIDRKVAQWARRIAFGPWTITRFN